MLCDTALLPLHKALPSIDSSRPASHANDAALERKIVTQLFRQVRDRLNRGLAEWEMVLRYCEARHQRPVDGTDSAMLRQIIDLGHVRKHIRDIKMLELSAKVELLALVHDM